MLKIAGDRIEHLERELASAQRHHAKVDAMVDSTPLHQQDNERENTNE